MQRRAALRNLLSFCGGICLLYSIPGCGLDGSVKSGTSGFTEKELALLSDICDTIIPPTNTPGAGELGVYLFIIKMIEDCRPPDHLQSFKAGLARLPEYAKKTTGKDWEGLSADKKLLLLQQIQGDRQAAKDLQGCIGEIRSLVIRGYSTNKYVMTKLVPYHLVPGHFYGCVPAAHDNSNNS